MNRFKAHKELIPPSETSRDFLYRQCVAQLGICSRFNLFQCKSEEKFIFNYQ